MPLSISNFNMNFKTIFTNWLAVGFILMLVVPSIFSFSGLGSDIVSTENRVLAVEPKLDLNLADLDASITQINDYPQAYSEFYKDSFYLRNRIIKETNSLKFKNLDVYDNPEVLIGKDGWLEHYSILVKNYLTIEFTDAETKNWYNKILARQLYYQNQNIKYFTVIVPIKSTVMPYNFPSYKSRIVPNAATKLVEYNSNHDNQIQLLYLDSVLSKNPEQYYYKSDFHWNFDGGYKGYEAITDFLRAGQVNMIKVNKEKCLKTSQDRRPGDILKLTGLDADYANYSSRIEQSVDKNTNLYDCQSTYLDKSTNSGLKNYIDPEVLNVDIADMDSVLVLRDSYTAFLEPFFRPSFSQFNSVYSPTVFESNSFELIQSTKPDVVIQILVESNMKRLAIENNAEIDQYTSQNSQAN
jgi:hypothetical protein